MGVKTKIFYEDIKPFFDIKTLEETNNGESHTVYILDDEYILKIYEEENIFNIDAEIKLLNYTSSLCVPKIIKNDIFIKGKRGLLFSKAKGESVKEFVKSTHLEQIAQFLKSFHKITKDKKHDNLSSFGKSELKALIKKTGNQVFEKEFDSLNIELKNDGIIHGDLFLDNATFCEDKLTCVFDFSDACEGDFIFDLSVVALSWCSNKSDVLVLLDAYDKSISLEEFIPYLRYASLYYCVKRHLANRDYDNIIFKKKFKELV
ncbi:phosphotransferase [Arcobacter sp.]|uniref:phosphotransferase n=1 Tax=Arcobacter sp. TaxID=1872629 RepID=UPI003D0AF593